MNIIPCAHHVQNEFCTTRAKYRQGKELKAVKVYTINDESQHLLIHNVPSIGLLNEITRLTAKFGRTEVVRMISDYPDTPEFTNVFYVKYYHLREARQAKKRLDNRSFFGNLLHVCYAPELESTEECRKKLNERFDFLQKSTREKPRFKAARNEKKTFEINAPTSIPDVGTGTWSNLFPLPSYQTAPARPNKLPASVAVASVSDDNDPDQLPVTG